MTDPAALHARHFECHESEVLEALVCIEGGAVHSRAQRVVAEGGPEGQDLLWAPEPAAILAGLVVVAALVALRLAVGWRARRRG